MLIMILLSYYFTKDKSGYDMIVELLHNYYPNDVEVDDWIKDYKL